MVEREGGREREMGVERAKERAKKREKERDSEQERERDTERAEDRPPKIDNKKQTSKQPLLVDVVDSRGCSMRGTHLPV